MAAGASIYGISYNSPNENRAWAEMMGFEFPLLSDPEHRAAEAMEVVRPPEDKLFFLPRRITYLVSPAGIIKRSYRVAREEIGNHPQHVLDDLIEELGRTEAVG